MGGRARPHQANTTGPQSVVLTVVVRPHTPLPFVNNVAVGDYPTERYYDPRPYDSRYARDDRYDDRRYDSRRDRYDDRDRDRRARYDDRSRRDYDRRYSDDRRY